MITALKEKQRQKALELLSRSYSTVSPSKAAGLLGLPETEVLTCESSFSLGYFLTLQSVRS